MSANQFVLELIGKDKSLGKSFKGAAKEASGATGAIHGFWNKMKAVEAILDASGTALAQEALDVQGRCEPEPPSKQV